LEVFSSIIRPGIEAPKVTERRVARIPVKVTMPARSLPNQLKATWPGVLSIKMLPSAARKEPRRQYIDS